MTIELDAWAPAFLDSVKGQLRAGLTRLVDGVPPQTVVGIGAYSDPDASTIVPVANTRAHWTAQSAARDELREYYRWAPEEWDLNYTTLLERGEPDDLADAQDELDRVRDQVERGEAGDDTLHTFRFMAWQAIVTALGQLFDEGFFDPFEDAVQVFAVSDSDLDGQTLDGWMRQLNTVDAAEEFTAYRTAFAGD